MTKNYRQELLHLTEIPENIYAIYIIPYSEYDGFWGKNGYMNYDFVFQDNHGKDLGWTHWEGDVINIFNNVNELYLSIDTPTDCGYIRLYSVHGIEIDKLIISSTTIKAKGR